MRFIDSITYQYATIYPIDDFLTNMTFRCESLKSANYDVLNKIANDFICNIPISMPPKGISYCIDSFTLITASITKVPNINIAVNKYLIKYIYLT
jgi:hypothetical protein